ncbi:MAG: hypothetical protein JSU70_23680 [Phycisphaerales bacterium]|nr:MAG: hypothetical protein JSU70_23680 [Phycisphaerales bacterium]
MEATGYESSGKSARAGSALILVVVLTSLLAMVGVLFLMAARVDKIATSAVTENRELNFAVDTVIAEISDQLVLDVPGVAGQEYYDYPDANNAWLAPLEPTFYDGGTPADPTDDVYYWRQVSDATGFLARMGFQSRSVNVDPPGTRQVIEEYPEIQLSGGVLVDQLADADGDGIADSKWVELDGITSGKGKPVYAAIRIIDNGAMLNVNTAYRFAPYDPDPNVPPMDGSSQIQIDLAALATGRDYVDEIHLARCGSGDPRWFAFTDRVIRRIESPWPGYLPFGISDELELRYRYCINSPALTRLESIWRDTIVHRKTDPYAGGTFGTLADWCKRVTEDPNVTEPDRRHLLTTYNMDRIINPGPIIDEYYNVVPDYKGGMDPNSPPLVLRRMVGLGAIVGQHNTPQRQAYKKQLYYAVRAGLMAADWPVPDPNTMAAQVTVNLIDYCDTDSEVESYQDVNYVPTSKPIGFETPCIYMSELACNVVVSGDPAERHTSYAVELYKPYAQDDDPDPNEWRLTIAGGNSIPISDWTSGSQFYVIRSEDPCAPLGSIGRGAIISDSNALVIDPNNTLYLERLVKWVAADGTPRTDFHNVDTVTIPPISAVSYWLTEDPNGAAHSIERDIKQHRCILRLWQQSDEAGSPTLGADNVFRHADPNIVQAHPANRPFTNIGEIGMIFQRGGYSIFRGSTEADVRVDLHNPAFAGLFQYLTILDPTTDGINNDGDRFSGGSNITDEIDPSPRWNLTPEFKVSGRINVNTAPWLVMAQLPWVRPELARAIVAYRDMLPLRDSVSGLVADYSAGRTIGTGSLMLLREVPGFISIGELATVVNQRDDADPYRAYSMRQYIDGADQQAYPDLTDSDRAADDFEERDLIFSRISNLVTVRSDVFTAYILVRIGADGPQKRVAAIFDRSNVLAPNDRVRIVALHPVPDSR